MEFPEDAPPLADAPAIAQRVAGFNCFLSKITTAATGAVKVELTVHPADVSQAFRLGLLPRTVMYSDFGLPDFDDTDEDWEELLNE